MTTRTRSGPSSRGSAGCAPRPRCWPPSGQCPGRREGRPIRRRSSRRRRSSPGVPLLGSRRAVRHQRDPHPDHPAGQRGDPLSWLRRGDRGRRRSASTSWTSRQWRSRRPGRTGPSINPGPFQFHRGPGLRPALDARARQPVLPEVHGPRADAADRRSPVRRPAGACATGSITTTTSSSPPDRPARPPGGLHGMSVVIPGLTSLIALVFAIALLDQWRVRRQALPAQLGDRDALLRDRQRAARRSRPRAAGMSRSTGPGT